MDPDPAVDVLAVLFPACELLGIEIPDDLPLDTADHRRMAVVWLGRLIMMQGRRSAGDGCD